MDSRAGRRGAVADAKVVAGVAHRTRRFGRPTALTFAAHEQRQVQARNGMATEVAECAGRSRRRLPGASRTGGSSSRVDVRSGVLSVGKDLGLARRVVLSSCRKRRILLLAR